MGWTQETTNSTEIGPWLDYAPAGTRYYRDAKGTIYQLYPPGIKPNAEPANPYSFSSSTLTAAELSAQGQAPAPKVAEFVPFNGKLDDYQDAVSAIEAKDYTRAANILQFLAADGNGDAQWRLAVMYQNGQGVPQDYKEAVKWNRLAAAQGNAFVHYNLAQMYESGQGTPQNFVQAHKWFNLAATSNVPSSAQRRDTLEQSMSPQQIALAQQMARDCQQRNFKGCD
jgi:TPR repeat protein